MRACISLFEVRPDPPRIMLMRPRIRTNTTAIMKMTAMMLKAVDTGLIPPARPGTGYRQGAFPSPRLPFEGFPSHIRASDTIGRTDASLTCCYETDPG